MCCLSANHVFVSVRILSLFVVVSCLDSIVVRDSVLVVKQLMTAFQQDFTGEQMETSRYMGKSRANTF